MKTIYILWLRQIKRYYRSKARIIGSIGQPLLFLIALGFGMGPIFQKAGEGNYIHFLVPGIVSQAILFMAVFSGIDLIWDKEFGFLKETLVAPVPRLHIMLGKTFGGATLATFQGLIVFVLSLFVGFRPINWLLLPLAICYMFLLACLFTSLGIAIASTLQDFHGFQLIMNFLVMPIFFLSGALFPVEKATGILNKIAQFNPLSYGVDAIRYLLTGVATYPLGLCFVVLFICTSILLSLGAYLFSKLEV